MRTVFADASYWIALLNPKDNLHSAAELVSAGLAPCRIVTTEMVLVELLNSLSNHGEQLRKAAVNTIESLSRNPNVDIVPQTSVQFHSAAARYALRLDKEWGATDCASFILMEEKRIADALTNDQHFRQAGFTVLMGADE